MKILLISEIFPPKVGGSGRWFWDIYTRLPRDIVVIAAGMDGDLRDFDSFHDLCCYRLSLLSSDLELTSIKGLFHYFKLFRQLKVIVEKEKISSVHCGRGLPEGFLGWLLWKWFKIPYCCYVHGEEVPIYGKSREFRLISTLAYRCSRQIIVNSDNTRRIYREYMPGGGKDICVMHPGVDTSYFVPAERNQMFREEIGWSNRKVLLTVGRLQKRKGHDHTILALKMISEALPNILYSIVGDGEEMESLENLVKEKGLENYVQFLGKQDDSIMLSCYQQCDLFIMANREVKADFEGFGIVFLEAQSCGKPVVAGNSGGTAETMLIGETGLMVDGNDPESIAATVIQMFQNETRLNSMGDKARDWVKTRFDWDVLMQQAVEVFNVQ